MGWTLPKGIWKNNAVGIGGDCQNFEYMDVGYTEHVPTAHITSDKWENVGDQPGANWAFGGPCTLPVKEVKGKYFYGYDINFAFARRMLKEGNWTKIK